MSILLKKCLERGGGFACCTFVLEGRSFAPSHGLVLERPPRHLTRHKPYWDSWAGRQAAIEGQRYYC